MTRSKALMRAFLFASLRMVGGLANKNNYFGRIFLIIKGLPQRGTHYGRA